MWAWVIVGSDMRRVEVDAGRVLSLLEKEPYTATELARILGIHHATVERLLWRLKSTNPDLRSKSIGRFVVYWRAPKENVEEYDEFIRSIFPALTKRIRVLVELYRRKAVSPSTAIKISSLGILDDDTKKILDELAEKQRVIITASGRIYLTQLGASIAEGAEKTYQM